jgi:hypothetical protein
MSTTSLIREQLKNAHQWFEGTMAGVTQEQAQWQPPGTAHPIGSRYAHAVVAEDVMVNALVKGEAPLYATTWAGNTGISDPQFNSTLEWARSVQVDLDDARRYAQAVYDNSDAYLATLKDEGLARVVDLSQQGLGEWPLDAFLLTFVLGHIRDIMGEVSALKGMQGLQGYPF